MQTCKVKKVADTIFVDELYGIPIGKDFKEIWLPFYSNKYFFIGSKLKQVKFFRTDIRKYSKKQILQVFQKYKELTKGNYDNIVNVANMLFWAYVSGSKEAEVYLKSFPEKFGPFDGAIAEEWDDISATYELWKTKKSK